MPNKFRSKDIPCKNFEIPNLSNIDKHIYVKPGNFKSSNGKSWQVAEDENCNNASANASKAKVFRSSEKTTQLTLNKS